ncbi:hypothetical protein M405DRAFT_752396 [Rhizopogon salebrosus TDB-379]|nr:hypothetical protein M405DRAFT_752396 [Rhizopogon salebrosus TDB-379]
MDPAKIKGISEWPVPKTLTQVRSFLGACNFYCTFIPVKNVETGCAECGTNVGGVLWSYSERFAPKG